MTADEYLEIASVCEREIDRLRKRIADARAAVEVLPPDRLRPMTPADVRVGRVVYYDRGPDPTDPDWSRWTWHVVEDVRDPHSDFKAYIAEGVRYGLNGSYVERESESGVG